MIEPLSWSGPEELFPAPDNLAARIGVEPGYASAGLVNLSNPVLEQRADTGLHGEQADHDLQRAPGVALALELQTELVCFPHSRLSLVCLDPTTVGAPAGASSAVPRAGGAQSPGGC